MTKKTDMIKPVATIAGIAFVSSLAVSSVAVADDNPFELAELDQGYMVADSHGKDEEGKCGEGKCGDDKDKEGKCGEGKCGDKDEEGKCGEGKCGDKEGEDDTGDD